MGTGEDCRQAQGWLGVGGMVVQVGMAQVKGGLEHNGNDYEWL